jgi:hypothetical protein
MAPSRRRSGGGDGEDLQQRGLAGAAGPDDAEELARVGAAGDVPEHVPETSSNDVAVVLLLLVEQVVCSAPHLERVSSCGHGDVVVDAPGFDLAPSGGGFLLLFFIASCLLDLARIGAKVVVGWPWPLLR